MADDSTPPGPVLGASGACPAVEWDGKTYTLGHPTQHAKDEYCAALLAAEKGAIDAQFARGWITAAERAARYEALGARADRLEHKTGGPLWLEYAGLRPDGADPAAAERKFLAGLQLFVWSLFREHHPDVSVQTVREMFAGCPDLVKLAVRRVVPNFFDWLAEALRVPRAALDGPLGPVLEGLEAALAGPGG